MFKKAFLSLTLPLLCAVVSMSFGTIKQSADSWYEETKAEILKQAALKSDSIGFLFNSDSSKKKEMHFFKGHMFLAKFYKKGAPTSESYFSKDGNFELRRLFCENAIVSFEGIAYKTSLFGPFTEYYCSGKIKLQGFRFQSEGIATWKTFNESGVLVDESNLKNHSLLNSLPQIVK
ncbi:hypothetical protein CNR22_21365 [Sphingobacteriaceae bacterium]|nr:hypothetical protein CNR22_21365 [Sphingobacteriaceae bacterium]